MTYNRTQDFYNDPFVAERGVEQWKVVHKFGRNGDIDVAAWEDIWTSGGPMHWPTVADTVSIVSSSANDASGGTGARSVRIEGLDANFNMAGETLTMNGVTAVESTVEFLRVARLYVVDAGAYSAMSTGGNAGTVSLTMTTGGQAMGEIEAFTLNTINLGQGQLARWTVPAGHEAFVRGVSIGVTDQQPARIIMWQRQGADITSAPFTAKRLVHFFDGAEDSSGLVDIAPFRFPEKTDIWFTALAGSNNTAVSVSFEIWYRRV